MALALLGIGESGVIKEFRTKDNVKKHLQDLGFLIGEKVSVVGENASGMILLVKGVRVALNKGLASKIVIGLN